MSATVFEYLVANIVAAGTLAPSLCCDLFEHTDHQRSVLDYSPRCSATHHQTHDKQITLSGSPMCGDCMYRCGGYTKPTIANSRRDTLLLHALKHI